MTNLSVVKFSVLQNNMFNLHILISNCILTGTGNYINITLINETLNYKYEEKLNNFFPADLLLNFLIQEIMGTL